MIFARLKNIPSIPLTSSYARRFKREGETLFMVVFSASGLFGIRSYIRLPSATNKYDL